MGIAEDEKINAVEESGEQETPDGEVADKREFFRVHLFVTWDPLSLYFYFDVSLPKKVLSALSHMVARGLTMLAPRFARNNDCIDYRIEAQYRDMTLIT
jgi:hypothetical protein